MRELDKFRGCMVGGAAGDALGYAIEFIHETQIFRRFGKDGITQYSLRGGVAQFSDDTQMTLFTANGLMNCRENNMQSYTDCIRDSYRDWYLTQAGTYPINANKHCWLLNVPGLFSRRAPGLTCISAIENGAHGTIENPINTSKGCGGVMRVAPIGLYFSGTQTAIEQSDMLAASAAAITHGHELGYIPAAALVHIIREVIESDDITLEQAVLNSTKAMEKLFSGLKHCGRFSELMQLTVELSHCELSTLEAIHQLGEGWVAEEALAISVYCALKYANDFDKAIIASVNHGGDSDSTGSITGNILGAYMGYDAIPDKYKQGLELKELIIELTDDLYEMKCGKMPQEELKKKYIDAAYEYKNS